MQVKMGKNVSFSYPACFDFSKKKEKKKRDTLKMDI